MIVNQLFATRNFRKVQRGINNKNSPNPIPVATMELPINVEIKAYGQKKIIDKQKIPKDLILKPKDKAISHNSNLSGKLGFGASLTTFR